VNKISTSHNENKQTDIPKSKPDSIDSKSETR